MTSAPQRELICVDFDGVLNKYRGDFAGPIPPPVAGARHFLERLNVRHIVVILTARDTDMVWAWLMEYALEDLIDNVTNEKPPAKAYIDDRAIPHDGDFNHTLTALDAFVPHWQA